MNSIKIFCMGYGESILLSDENECLLVDCGSESEDKNEYFDNVEEALKKYNKKSAMISHFHEDHINGFMSAALKQPYLFETVYIPHIFTSEHPNITDLELIKYILQMKSFPKYKPLTLWDFLNLLCKNRQKIKLIKRGDKFDCVGESFDVLWPVPEKLVDGKFKSNINKSFNNDFLTKIYNLSDEIRRVFLALESSQGDLPNVYVDEVIGEIYTEAEKLSAEDIGLKDFKFYGRFVQSISNNANKSSVVFQNSRDEFSVLLTGDITNVIMKKIAENSVLPSMPLSEHYHVLKAPHHGTDTYYFNFGAYTLFDKLIISNGETDMSSRGKISRNYNLRYRNYDIVCTNYFQKRCENLCANPCNRCRGDGDVCGGLMLYGYLEVI